MMERSQVLELKPLERAVALDLFRCAGLEKPIRISAIALRKEAKHDDCTDGNHTADDKRE